MDSEDLRLSWGRIVEEKREARVGKGSMTGTGGDQEKKFKK
jgi:hypothetical protein